jgi:hypothetical protein
MCLAQGQMTRCVKRLDERGPGCEFHDAKAMGLPPPARTQAPAFIYLRVSPNKKSVAPPAAFEVRELR